MKKLILLIVIFSLMQPGFSFGADKKNSIKSEYNINIRSLEEISKAEKIFQEKVTGLAKRVGQKCIAESEGGAYILFKGADCNYDMMDLIFNVLDYIDKKTKRLENLRFFEYDDNLKLYYEEDN